MRRHTKFVNSELFSRLSNTLKNYFHFKEFVPETLRSSLVTNFCGEAAQPDL